MMVYSPLLAVGQLSRHLVRDVCQFDVGARHHGVPTLEPDRSSLMSIDEDTKRCGFDEIAKEVSKEPGPSYQFSLCFFHRDRMQIVPLPVGHSLVVGRLPPAEVVIQDSNLSRQHARFATASIYGWRA